EHQDLAGLPFLITRENGDRKRPRLVRHSDSEAVACIERHGRAVPHGDGADVVDLAGRRLSSLYQNLLKRRNEFVRYLPRRVGDAKCEITVGSDGCWARKMSFRSGIRGIRRDGT